MLRLSKLTDYGVVVLIRLADGDPVQTSPAIALATSVPEPTVAKVLKALAGGELVISQRGARGGYRLARPLSSITVADVIAAVDGPIALTACVDGVVGGCEVEHNCAMKGRWDVVNAAIRTALHAITLADMRQNVVPPAVRPPEPLAPHADLPAAE
jgi:FeS assembly SUF system regulator